MIVIAILAALLAVVAIGCAIKALKKKNELVYEIEIEHKPVRAKSQATPEEKCVFNKRVWDLRDAGESQQKIADKLGVSRSTIRRELKKGRIYA